jgi:hypothetical protein
MNEMLTLQESIKLVLREDVNLIYIRDFLGHVDVVTTEV